MANGDEPKPSTSSTSARAKARLNQVSSHIVPTVSSDPAPDAQPPQNTDPVPSNSQNTPRRRRRKSNNDPPENHSDILSQISRLQDLARTPDTNHRGYARQKAAGKLWVRERVHALFDTDSVREIGSISGTVTWDIIQNSSSSSPTNYNSQDSSSSQGSPNSRGAGSQRETPAAFTPSNNVLGFGKLSGRKVCFTADDYSLRAGHADGALWHKTLYIEKLALSLKLPMIKLVDGSSGGGSVTTIRSTGYSYVPPLTSFDVVVQQINSGIPNLAAVLGPAIGLGAARAVSCHFSVLAGDVGSLFNAGPKVVEGATFEEGLSLKDLGGAEVHCTNGTIDNFARDEKDAFAQVRRCLSFLPDHGGAVPPVLLAEDGSERRDEWLRSAIPRRKERMYDVRKIIRTVVDLDSWFEIGALWGTTVVVGLARLAGKPVAIMANNCEVGAGALDAAGSQKVSKHLKFADVFNLPIVQFVDIPGYAIGTVAERTATMRFGVNLVMTYYSTTTPIFSVIIRKVYGVAGAAMMDSRDPRMRVAWPSGDWGSLPLNGGIEVGHRAELKKAFEEGDKSGGKDEGEKKQKELLDTLYAEYTRLQSPIRTANAFGVEEIIDPAVTRSVLCEWVEHVYEQLLPTRLLDRANGKIRPTFA